jgi:hypothetical protein
MIVSDNNNEFGPLTIIIRATILSRHASLPFFQAHFEKWEKQIYNIDKIK